PPRQARRFAQVLPAGCRRRTTTPFSNSTSELVLASRGRLLANLQRRRPKRCDRDSCRAIGLKDSSACGPIAEFRRTDCRDLSFPFFTKLVRESPRFVRRDGFDHLVRNMKPRRGSQEWSTTRKSA